MNGYFSHEPIRTKRHEGRTVWKRGTCLIDLSSPFLQQRTHARSKPRENKRSCRRVSTCNDGTMSVDTNEWTMLDDDDDEDEWVDHEGRR